jgi:hypothetical protein
MATPKYHEVKAWPLLSRVYGYRAVYLHSVVMDVDGTDGEPVEGRFNPSVNYEPNPARLACLAIESAAQFLVLRQLQAGLRPGIRPLLGSVKAEFNDNLMGSGILHSVVTEEVGNEKRDFAATVELTRGEKAAGTVDIVGKLAPELAIRQGRIKTESGSIDDVAIPTGAATIGGRWATKHSYANGHFRGKNMRIIPGYQQLMVLIDAADQAIGGNISDSSKLRVPLAKSLAVPSYIEADFSGMIAPGDEVDYRAWRSGDSDATGVLYTRGLKACEAEIRW